ncbi:cell wall hydrolase [Parerythrobacter jejuensis]|uniref:Cell wall hydrolase n=1 Tax=Parerythrobacter jejuensis TaxID=795812 RepID=A0A845B425_9SPHN|nr:cell wall hydrolase [Parerythrobacter jejuensis]MXP30958.1 cell wall hydrolase [Parerythrobacter jejuensis]MXP33718.1 cell wall hydrolase [Parerythrobacter jejuensis]
MSRKTHKASVVAIAAMLGLIVASAETSGANAQQGDMATIPDQPMVEETVPVFVSEEVVQTVPETPAEPEAKADQPVSANSLRSLIAQVDAPQDLSRQMECLAGTVYFESRGEPIHGQLAVAQVVINRAESNAFPSDYCGVVYQRSQFSFVKNGTMPRIKRGSAAWVRAKKIAKIAHEGLWESEAQDSLYFHANYVKPRWSYRKQRRASINTHIFYR